MATISADFKAPLAINLQEAVLRGHHRAGRRRKHRDHCAGRQYRRIDDLRHEGFRTRNGTRIAGRSDEIPGAALELKTRRSPCSTGAFEMLYFATGRASGAPGRNRTSTPCGTRF